jgi:heme exporter protein A
MVSSYESFLELRAVSHFFGPRLVFRGIDLNLAPTEILLVIGPNGAGKSTLLQIMAGLLRPASGSVCCRLQAGEVGYLGHGTFIYPFLSALENLSFWGQLYGLRPARETILALLDRVGLKAAALERAGTFSRGMAQRLSLARVLLINPKLLLLDEPATGLDVASRKLLEEEIVLAKARGAGIVWISHDGLRDQKMADRVLVLRDKRVAFLGPVQEYDGWSGHA